MVTLASASTPKAGQWFGAAMTPSQMESLLLSWDLSGFNVNVLLFSLAHLHHIHSADACRTLQLLSRDERKALLTKYYAEAFQIKEEPVDYHEKNWNEEPWSGGCYMGTCAPGVLTSFFPAIRETIADGRIHFAGTETAIRWSGYMDGAIESGVRCAHEVRGEPFDYRKRPKSHLLTNPSVNFTALERNAPSLRTVLAALVSLPVLGALFFLRSRL